jgi:hypothetical protein
MLDTWQPVADLMANVNEIRTLPPTELAKRVEARAKSNWMTNCLIYHEEND